MKAALALFAPIALAACAVIPQAAIAPQGSAVGLGQRVAVGPLVATPVAVVTDSRCPINARCVWAGELIVSTRIEGDGWQEIANLKLGDTFSTHGTQIALASGEPGRMAGADEPRPADYRFTFE